MGLEVLISAGMTGAAVALTGWWALRDLEVLELRRGGGDRSRPALGRRGPGPIPARRLRLVEPVPAA